MKLSKYFFFLPVLIIIIIALVVLLINYKSTILEFTYSINYHKPDNLDFSVKSCDKNISGYDMDKMGVKEANWKDNNTLSAKAYVSIFCDGENISYPNYRIEGNNLVLEYRSITENVVAMCMCAKELNYLINNLPKKNYNVILRGKNF